jgi:Platelet-activating factor acetylhydrolase, isoform II
MKPILLTTTMLCIVVGAVANSDCTFLRVEQVSKKGGVHVLASSVQASNSTPTHSVASKLPIPSGQYGIGRVGFDWVDENRRDRLDPEHHRELMVYLWYPTARSDADIKGTYLPGAKAMDARPDTQRLMRDEFGAKWPLIVSGDIYSHAVEQAPVAKTAANLPLVVFSHGNGSTSFTYTWLIEDLVSHGYVVAAIEHTGTALMVWFPDGRLMPYREAPIPANASPSERMQKQMESISKGITEGAEDVRFVLDRISQLNKTGKGQFPLKGRIDLSLFAAMGHSAGAEFAARACQLDDRLKACVDLDGAMVPIAALPIYPDQATMKQPLLFLEANHPESQMGGSPGEHQEFFNVKEKQLRDCPSGTYDVILKSPGIAHPSFSDMPVLFAGEGEYPAPELVSHNIDLIERFVRTFVDRNLKGVQNSNVFKAPGAEVEIRRYGTTAASHGNP